jgi:phospholipid/cholesterol/gamma-HCH transport system permease protein
MLLNIVHAFGFQTLVILDGLGAFALFFINICTTFLSSRLKLHKTFEQMKAIGSDSLAIVVLTGASSGAVLALQSYFGFKRFGAEEFIGPVVALTLTRELGPVLTGLMVAGRAGSAITAELGTMKITEQLDALKTLGIDFNQFLMVPRVLAGTIILPFLTLFCMIFGIVGGYVVAVNSLHLNGQQYIDGIKTFLEFSDITGGLIKSSVFGLILSWVSCYKGYKTEGGAKGVGISTTQSVVMSSILILIADYFLTALLFK